MSNKSEEKKPVKWSKESDKELKRLSKASINWTEVAKWDAEGRPYEEDEEILMFLNKNGTNLGSNGTGQTDINGGRKQNCREAFYTSSRKRNESGEECCSKTPAKNPQPPDVTIINIIKLLDRI